MVKQFGKQPKAGNGKGAERPLFNCIIAGKYNNSQCSCLSEIIPVTALAKKNTTLKHVKNHQRRDA